MSLVIILFVLVAGVFLYLNYMWESSIKRPKVKDNPFISIFIPAYNSEKTIRKTIQSALNLDYPKKEIFVVNDSKDNTQKICKSLGVKCIQNKKRLGKAIALNKAVNQAKGKILFFLDADTITRKNTIRTLIPWFANRDIGAVVPKYIAQNPNSFISKLASIEHSFLSSIFKTQMFFGSMIAFRGCGVMIRKSVFKKLGGWPKTQMEDNGFAALLVKRGYKIQYDPSAIVETKEPETIYDLKKQRMRWGKGAFYTFWTHKSAYKSSSQFLISTLPYTILTLALLLLVIFNAYIYLVPALAFLASTTSSEQIISVFILLILPLILNFLFVLVVGSVLHFALLTYPEEHDSKSLIYLPLYIFFYIPAVLIFYTKGILAGIRDKIRRRQELDFDNW